MKQFTARIQYKSVITRIQSNPSPVLISGQYVLHSSQSMVIRVTLSLIFSRQVEVVGCSYTVGMLLCLLC